VSNDALTWSAQRRAHAVLDAGGGRRELHRPVDQRIVELRVKNELIAVLGDPLLDRRRVEHLAVGRGETRPEGLERSDAPDQRTHVHGLPIDLQLLCGVEDRPHVVLHDAQRLPEVEDVGTGVTEAGDLARDVGHRRLADDVARGDVGETSAHAGQVFALAVDLLQQRLELLLDGEQP
jgi:hypothetical protein